MALAIGSFLYSVNLRSYVHLSRKGTRVTGLVVAREPENHDSLTARYTVNGQVYELRTSFVAEPNPDKGKLHVGDSVTVVYLPTSPRTATLGEPRALIANEAISIALSMLMAPTFILLWVTWRARRMG
jgi:hypothetical protein